MIDLHGGQSHFLQWLCHHKGDVPMSAMDVLKQVMAAVEAGDFAKVDKMTAADFVFEGPVPEPVGKAQWLGLQQALGVAIPDWKFNPTGMTEDGDTVHVTFAITGTHTGTLNLPMLPGPVAATGKKISLPSEPSDFTVKNGMLTHIMVHTGPGGGVTGILQQIGVPMPPM
jgi:hypothetical protein